MTPEYIQAVKELFTTPKNITITMHRNPDGDAIGSSLGLYRFLRMKGHIVNVIAPNEFPDFLAWLPDADSITVFEKDTEKAIKLLDNSQIIFTLDYNTLSRTGDKMQHILEKQEADFIMIDHHQEPADYAKYMFSDSKYGSTCEMIYHFITALEEGSCIDKDLGECLYTGIVTDSGSFRYPSTTSTTHQVAAALIDLGIDNSKIHSNLFDNNSANRLQILARALHNMKVMPEYNTSYTCMTQDELNKLGHTKGDTEGIVNYGLSIKGIVFTAFFTENKDEGIIKISFRSKGDFDVNKYARKYFNGGGHINAAGGRSVETMENTIQKFIATLADTKINQIL